MAIFGFHIVLTMITATFAHRLLPRFAPCCQLLTSFLHRYAMPAKSISDDPKPGGNSRQPKTRKRNNAPINEVSSSSDADTLFRVPVSIVDLSNIPFTSEVEIIFDFAMASLIVLSIADIRALIYPCEAASESNLSLVWCWIALGLAIRALYVTLRIFMRETSFLSVCLMSGCVFALLSMVVLSFPDNLVDLKLRVAHESIETAINSAFNRTAAAVVVDEAVESSPLSASPQLNFNVFRGLLALFAGAFGTLLTFPGLRFIKLYTAATHKEYQSTGSFKEAFGFYFLRGLLHLALLAPLILILLWLKPVTTAIFNYNQPNVEDKLNSIRTVAMFAMGALHMLVCIPLLQTHLDGAERRVAYCLSKQNTSNPGRPAEKPTDLRREVNMPSQSLGIVAVQMMAPALMMIILALLFKSLVGASWLPEDFRRNCTTNGTETISSSTTPQALSGTDLLNQLLSKISYDDSLSNMATDLSSSLARFRLAAGSSSAIWHSTLGFAVFWACMVQLLTAMFGLWNARATVGDPDQSLF